MLFQIRHVGPLAPEYFLLTFNSMHTIPCCFSECQLLAFCLHAYVRLLRLYSVCSVAECQQLQCSTFGKCMLSAYSTICMLFGILVNKLWSYCCTLRDEVLKAILVDMSILHSGVTVTVNTTGCGLSTKSHVSNNVPACIYLITYLFHTRVQLFYFHKC